MERLAFKFGSLQGVALSQCKQRSICEMHEARSRDSTTWRKSSYSNADGGDCVEVAETHRTALVRDSKHRELGHLAFPAPEWAAFLRGVREERI